MRHCKTHTIVVGVPGAESDYAFDYVAAGFGEISSILIVVVRKNSSLEEVTHILC